MKYYSILWNIFFIVLMGSYCTLLMYIMILKIERRILKKKIENIENSKVFPSLSLLSIDNSDYEELNDYDSPKSDKSDLIFTL